MPYKFITDPNLNLNFEDDILYTPLKTKININAISNDDIKNTNVPIKMKETYHFSIFSWFIIIAIISLLIWYTYGWMRKNDILVIDLNKKDINLKLQSPDYGRYMKYGIY